MKALIASGGRGTRLRPITHTQNKHLIPIANKPILYYAIEAAVGAGIKEIGIVHNGESQEVPNYVGDGWKWGVKITYIPQSEPGGLAQVVALAEPFIGKEKFVFYLGDNMIVTDLKQFIEKFEKEGCNCLLTLARVKDPGRFGVPEIKDVAGIYFYDHHIFEAVRSLKPSGRGELEISDAHQYLLDHGFKVGHAEITGWWKDTGKPTDLLEANRLVLDNITQRMEGKVDRNSDVAGRVGVEKGARIVNSKVRGPAIIGRDCLIEDSYIGPYTSIGDRTEVKNSEIEYSILLRDCKVHNVGIRIEGSILGNDVEIVEASGKPQVHRFMIGDQSRVEIAK
jgi:glucose-1-phosphate thymidylyltransferase